MQKTYFTSRGDIVGPFCNLKKTLGLLAGCLLLIASGYGRPPASPTNPAPSIFLEKTITGTVTDLAEDGGLPGVNVLLKGSTVGTVTDIDGNYQITVPDDAETLVFSSVGYESTEEPIGNRTVIDVALAPDIQSLSEVVVIGYGTQERKDITGAVTSVDAEQISRQPIANVQQALQGQTPGVQVTQQGGQPGGGVDVKIRGVGSINSANSPLYVVDGVIINGNLENISPSDIESVDVLKDASASAIYGARAANGVVLITTKRGKQGPAQFSFDAYYGTQSAWRTLDVLNSSQYQDVTNEAYRNAGLDLIPALDSGALTRTTDWQDAVLQNAPIQNYSLGVRGGGENTRYYVSASYFDQEGIIVGTGVRRGSLRVNTDSEKGRFKFGNSIQASRTDRSGEGSNNTTSILQGALQGVPYLPIYDDNNVGGFAGPGPNDGEPWTNPLAIQTLVTDQNVRDRVIGNVYGEVELLEGLSYRANLGVDLASTNVRYYAPFFEQAGGASEQIPGFEQVPLLRQTSRSQFSWIAENLLTYEKSFGDHNLSALVGYTAQESSTQEQSTEVSGGNLNSVQVLNGSANVLSALGTLDEWAISSILGRVSYDYAGRYLLQFNVRRDGSSRFGPENRYGTFPSVSAGWRISEESFMQEISGTLSDLKIRGSYGVLGNDGIGNYTWQTTLNPNAGYVIGRDQVFAGAVVPSGLPNEGLRWEEVSQLNVGLDAGLFNNRVLFNVDYYVKTTTDMLLNAEVPRSSGATIITLNAGEVRNRGLEFALRYRDNEGPLRYQIGANLTTIDNEVISLGNNDAIETGPWNQQSNALRKRTDVGQPIGSFYGYQTAGIFQSYEQIRGAALPPGVSPFDDDGNLLTGEDLEGKVAPGDIIYQDINGRDEEGDLTGRPDGVIDEDDRAFLGSPIPDLVYGFDASVSYQGFDLYVLLQGVSGNDIFSETKFSLEGYHRAYNLGPAVLDRWTESNPNGTVPRAIPSTFNYNTRVSDRWIEDGSYLRVKNVQLGYTLPEALRSRLSLTKARVYVSAQNLFTFTNYLGFDPEVGAPGGSGARGELNFNGIDRVVYPQARTFLIGVQFGF